MLSLASSRAEHESKRRCRDNAVAKSFFSSSKKERLKKRILGNRELASKATAAYIDDFYNSTRRHSHPGGVSPDQFEAVQNGRG